MNRHSFLIMMATLFSTALAPAYSAEPQHESFQLAFNHMGYGNKQGFNRSGMGKRRSEGKKRNYKKGCKAVCSGFSSRYRCDGSRRSPRYPIHGGIDMAIPVGTPILAAADGEVVKSGRGHSIGGIILVIRHPPEATGLKDYYFSRYLHLNKVSSFKVGSQVKKGQQVAESGKTGTVGSRYYGARGFPHLHYEVRKGKSAHYAKAKKSSPLAFIKAAGDKAAWPCR